MSRRTQIGIVASFLIVGAAFVFLGMTLNNVSAELDGTKATLQSTASDLAQEEADNAALRTEKVGLEGSLEDANAQNAALTQANAGLAQDKAVTEANLADTLDAIDEWSVAYETSQEELLESRTAYDELEEARDTLLTQHQVLTRVHRDLDQQHQSLSTEHRRLVDQHDELKGRAGTLEQLAGQVAVLEAEIMELEAKRRPLILAVDRRGFACTGSMEPKITCLDEATWLENFDPKDIAVGTTITFDPNCWEDEADGIGTAHRVMKIKVENGVHHYWPKGDASEEADGCWVPESNVTGYIVEIHKGVRPENAELRDRVNDASMKEAEAWEALQAARVKLDELEAAYFAIIERYCGPGVEPGDCSLPSPEYEIAIAAHRAYESAYRDYEYALEVWEGWSDYHECWVDSASSAIPSLSEGSPPIYRLCISPPPAVPPFRGR